MNRQRNRSQWHGRQFTTEDSQVFPLFFFLAFLHLLPAFLSFLQVNTLSVSLLGLPLLLHPVKRNVKKIADVFLESRLQILKCIHTWTTRPLYAGKACRNQQQVIKSSILASYPIFFFFTSYRSLRETVRFITPKIPNVEM